MERTIADAADYPATFAQRGPCLARSWRPSPASDSADHRDPRAHLLRAGTPRCRPATPVNAATAREPRKAESHAGTREYAPSTHLRITAPGTQEAVQVAPSPPPEQERRPSNRSPRRRNAVTACITRSAGGSGIAPVGAARPRRAWMPKQVRGCVPE